MDFLKNKSKDCNIIDNYNNYLKEKIETNIPVIKNKQKYDSDFLHIPSLSEYYLITKINYNINQLKQIATYYNIKKSGNKNQLVNRLYTFIYLSFWIIKIQKIFRGFIQRKLNKLKGEGLFDRKVCNNNEDFVTFEELSMLPYDQFYSYKDKDNFIYGFDIASMYNLIEKSKNNRNNNNILTNPYNRNEFPSKIPKDIKHIIKLNKLLERKSNLLFEEETKISSEKEVLFRALKLFQIIDYLGNYSDHNWFLSLSKNSLVIFVRELNDIWNYRAQLSDEVKRNILPPNGKLFVNLYQYQINRIDNKLFLQKIILESLEKLVNDGITQDYRSLGAIYILSALTLVNTQASESLPWLYQSVSH
jgi:hypothetical protein